MFSNALNTEIGQIKKVFTIPNEKLNLLIKAFQGEMDLGLSGKRSSIKMFPAFVDTPTGNKKGRFLAVDIGGTNSRVAMVDLLGGRKKPQAIGLGDENCRLVFTPQHLGDWDLVFRDTTKLIESLLNEYSSEVKPKYLGYTFSFPIVQTAIDKGKLKKVTKGFRDDRLTGKDVVEPFKKEIEKQKLEITISSLDNDTVATLAYGAYQETECDVGVIIGTGTNASVRAPITMVNQKRLGKYIGDNILINMECGIKN